MVSLCFMHKHTSILQHKLLKILTKIFCNCVASLLADLLTYHCITNEANLVVAVAVIML